jgi:uncharacterized ferritin-like protein (DUF455 family)
MTCIAGCTGNSLRARALGALLLVDPAAKVRAVADLADTPAVGTGDSFSALVLIMPEGPAPFMQEDQVLAAIPGRPARPHLVHPQHVKQRAMGTHEGRAALIHSLAHIEFNAINLALDIIWRYAGMPESFYRDWARVASEEALHYSMLSAHLKTLGWTYGDMPAHDGLWEMAERTAGDLLARLALVPRTLEARGLDASPLVRDKLAAAGDSAAAAIIDIILRDEIGHVAIGNHWYRHLCQARSLDPIAEFPKLAAQYRAPRMRGPFNLPARRAAGFTEAELQALQERAAGP